MKIFHFSEAIKCPTLKWKVFVSFKVKGNLRGAPITLCHRHDETVSHYGIYTALPHGCAGGHGDGGSSLLYFFWLCCGFAHCLLFCRLADFLELSSSTVCKMSGGQTVVACIVYYCLFL